MSGFVYDENRNPIAYANIFVRELNSGTSTDEQGQYFLTLNPGIYNVVVSSVGYKSISEKIVIGDKNLNLNFKLETSKTQLEEIVVKASKRDPAYEIIKNAIDNKDKYLTQISSFKADVYVKATEVVDSKKKKQQEVKKEEEEDVTATGPPLDPFSKDLKVKPSQINMVEMQIVLNFQNPNQYKEERTAYKAYGSRAGLFIPLFSETDFNFYHNMVNLKKISEVPLISPLSRTAILSYKYKLEETLVENGQVVYKIRVTPRKTGNSTCRGLIYINDKHWNINRLELELQKGSMKFYDAFTIKQDYKVLEDSVWIPYRQEFSYLTKEGGKSFEGNTLIRYGDFKKDYIFPPKFFGNEVSVITKEAYKRDSSFWNSSRPEPLTIDEKKVISYRDSIEAKHNSKEYLDSIEAHFNKVRIGEVIYHGIQFRSHKNKTSFYLSPILGFVGMEVIGGFRLSPYTSYFKRFESGRMFSASGSFSYGIKNQDLQGNANLWTRYDPYHLGDLSLRIGRSFMSINNFDAYLNQLSISNYILHDYVHLFHRREFFNGFYLSTDFGLHNRQSLDRYDRTSILNRIIPEREHIEFEGYQAFISNTRISYTPMQRYMSEPNQKVVLGSKYPTFSLIHRKGWNGIFSSDINFDYLEGAIEQDIPFGTLGNSRYNFMAGKFVNTTDLRLVDMKRFRQSDPYLYSNPLHSFQLLDTALVARSWFLEVHYIHHFNGAMINNIPFIKKTKLRTVAGAGFMWVHENNFRHQEVFGGIERVFKLGVRRRLRVGLFGVIGQSNQDLPKTGYKISFDIIDTWKRDWSY
jgi:hypothetical protein